MNATYIWVPADGLDGLVVKVARVADHAADDVVCVLQPVEDLRRHGELRPLAQLHALAGALCVDALDPVVVLLGVALLDVLLEDDHVRVGHLLGLRRRQDRRRVLVDGADLQHGRGSGKRREKGQGSVPHDGGVSHSESM
jgi:translation initiation factor IF-1